MPEFITAIYDRSDSAAEAIDALKEAGVSSADIQYVDRERLERERFFERLFLDENGDAEDTSFRLMGIERDAVDRITAMIESGHGLVIVLSDGEQARRAREILDRYGAIDLEGNGGWDQSQGPPKWFRVVEIEPNDLRRGARAHAVHVRPRRDIHHVSSDALPGAHQRRRFRSLETEFRVHHRENYADTGHPFEAYELAYRYGMALAENRGLEDRKWSDLRGYARDGWTEHTDRRWTDYEEAVRFGWRRVRAEQRREQRRFEQGRWTH